MSLENYEYIAPNLFVVRTQAGFKQVLKLHQDSNRKDHMPVEGFPVSYPSFVTIHLGYRGHHYLDVTCWPVNLIADACKRHTPERAPVMESYHGAELG